MSEKSSTSPLEQFVLLAKTAKGAAAVGLIKQVLEAPGVYVFGELLDMPNIQEVICCNWQNSLWATGSKNMIQFEPFSEKTNNLSFRPGPTQTGLHIHINEKFEISDLVNIVKEALCYLWSENKVADSCANTGCTYI